MIGTYILDPQGHPKRADFDEWGRWRQTVDRQVADTQIGGVRISTVFFGLDPVLWETMVFGGEHDGYQKRYSSRADAERGHRAAVALVQRKERV